MSLGKSAAAAAGAGLGATVLFAPAAQGATFTVTSLADDGSDGTLRKEITDANVAGGDDTIVFQSGLTGTIQLAPGADTDIEIYGDSLDIQGPGASALTIRGAGTDRLFELTNANTTTDQVIFSGLTLTNGDGTPSGKSGGAIASDIDGGTFALDVIVRDSVLTGNKAEDGGALYTFYAALVIENSAITNNESYHHGGGVYLYGANQDGTAPAALTVTNSTISDNTASTDTGSSDDGGGISQVEPTGGTVITNSTISGNKTTGNGGGLRFYSDNLTGGGTGGPLTITNSMFSANEATENGYGGGLVLYGPEVKDVTIAGSTFSANKAEGGGGGMELFGIGGNVLIENTTVSGNVADSENDNTGYGGGIASYNRDTEPTPDTDHERTIRNSTIVDNTAFYGGGIRAYLFDNPGGPDDVLKLSSTIVANNTDRSPAGPTNGPDLGVHNGASPVTGNFELGFSLVETIESDAPVTENPAGSNLLGVDPALGGLTNNGGPTLTHLPAVTSPAIDAGVANGLATDQRGFPRTFDMPVANRTGSDATDIGAVEVAPLCNGLAPTIVSSNGAATGTDGPDVIVGTHLKDTINGGGGDDLICAGGGNDIANGGAGKDAVLGEDGKDKASGGGGKDNLKGGDGKDNLSGGGGADKLKGNAAKDLLKGGGGKDKLSGGPAKDVLKGGGGRDKLNGGPGNDQEIQ